MSAPRLPLRVLSRAVAPSLRTTVSLPQPCSAFHRLPTRTPTAASSFSSILYGFTVGSSIPQAQRRHYYQTPTIKHIASSSSSVDPSEVTHFTALASSWWDPHGPSRLLHLMNPLRHDFLATCLASVPYTASSGSDGESTGITYLDIGCGGGIFAESAARLPGTRHVTGLDPTDAVLEVARAHAMTDPSLRGKLDYIRGDVEGFAAAFSVPSGPSASVSDDATITTTDQQGDSKTRSSMTKQYDIISVFEVLEHVPSPSSFLDSALPLLKPGGWLVGSTIARTWTSWVTTKLVAEDLLRIVPRGTHEWNKYVNPGELKSYLGHPDRKKVGGDGGWDEGSLVVMGVVYVPGLGWRKVRGSEEVGNYFFGFRKAVESIG